MTATEIRNHASKCVENGLAGVKSGMTQAETGLFLHTVLESTKILLLAEIAAQLAELNGRKDKLGGG